MRLQGGGELDLELVDPVFVCLVFALPFVGFDLVQGGGFAKGADGIFSFAQVVAIFLGCL